MSLLHDHLEQRLSVHVGCYYGCYSVPSSVPVVRATGEMWSQQQELGLWQEGVRKVMRGEELLLCKSLAFSSQMDMPAPSTSESKSLVQKSHFSGSFARNFMLGRQTHQRTGDGPFHTQVLGCSLAFFSSPLKGAQQAEVGVGRERCLERYNRSYLMWPSDKSLFTLGINFCFMVA